MAYTKEQLQALTDLANKNGGIGSTQFKGVVEKSQGVGSYDRLVTELKSQAAAKNVVATPPTTPTPITLPPAEKTVMPTPVISTISKPLTGPAPTPTPTPTPKDVSTISKPLAGPTPAPTPTPTPKDVSKILTIDQFKAKGSTLPNLEQFIEDRYGTMASQEGDGVTAVVNGEKFKWTIKDGNPVKVSLGKVTNLSDEEQKAIDLQNTATQTIEKAKQDLSIQQQNNLKDPENLFKTLKTGGLIDNFIKNTPEYIKAKNRFDNFTKIKNMSSSQLRGTLQSGLLLTGSQLYNDLVNDPITKQKIDNTNKENEIANNNISAVNNEVVNNTINKVNGPIAKIMEDNYMDEEEQKKLLSSPEIEEKTTEVNNNLIKYKEILRTYNQIEDEVSKELEGTGATMSTKIALIYTKQKALKSKLDEAKDNYETSFGILKDLKQEKVDLFKINFDLYTSQVKSIADKQAIIDKQAYDKQVLDEGRAYNEGKVVTDLQNANLYKNGDINSEDPFIQNKGIETAITGMYKQLGDFANQMEAPEVKINKVKQLIENGKTPEEALTIVNNEIKSTQRYKDYIKNENLKNTPKVAENWQKLDDNTLYNQVTGETKQLTGGQNQLNTISKETGESGGPCGTYARIYTGISGSLNNVVGEFKEQREKAFKDKAPVVGGLVFFNGKGYDKTYGHIAVVTGINQYGTITITESNLKGDGKVTTRVINPYEASGYYNNTPLANGGQSSGGQVNGYTKKQEDAMKALGGSKPTAGDLKALKELGLDLSDYGNFNAMNGIVNKDIKEAKNKFNTLPQVEDYNSAQSVQQWLNENKDKNFTGPDIQGLISNYAKILDPTSVVRESEYAMAQKGANQGVIDSTKQKISTFINGGSELLSKEAKNILIQSLQKRLNGIKGAYEERAKIEVKAQKANNVPLTYEQLTGKKSYTDKSGKIWTTDNFRDAVNKDITSGKLTLEEAKKRIKNAGFENDIFINSNWNKNPKKEVKKPKAEDYLKSLGIK